MTTLHSILSFLILNKESIGQHYLIDSPYPISTNFHYQIISSDQVNTLYYDRNKIFLSKVSSLMHTEVDKLIYALARLGSGDPGLVLFTPDTNKALAILLMHQTMDSLIKNMFICK